MAFGQRWNEKYGRMVVIKRNMSRASACDGYNKAKAEMKTFTAEIRLLRKENELITKWDNSGNIVRMVGKEHKMPGHDISTRTVYNWNSIKHLSELYVAEQHLLSNKGVGK